MKKMTLAAIVVAIMMMATVAMAGTNFVPFKRTVSSCDHKVVVFTQYEYPDSSAGYLVKEVCTEIYLKESHRTHCSCHTEVDSVKTGGEYWDDEKLVMGFSVPWFAKNNRVSDKPRRTDEGDMVVTTMHWTQSLRSVVNN